MITRLDDLTPAQHQRAGAKACHCARLKQAGIPVPDGLVVLSTATQADVAALPEQPWFDDVAGDTMFAVRSSGIGEDGEGESFAGIHQTLLNVCRADVPEAVTACRASGHAPQALEYRRAKGMPTDQIEMGVLVQRMIHAVSAGVAFTVNPVTGADDEVVINSSWGLGEALVSGQIDPDEFIVGKQDATLRWSRLGDKGAPGGPAAASLTARQIQELAALVTRIERHYGTPQDVEWCHDGLRFWVVQSRPVTTSRGSVHETEWTRANLAEVLPDITSPQALAVFEQMLDRAERTYLGSLAAPEKELGPIVKAFHGRLFFNLSQLRRVCALGNVAPAIMLKSMGHAGAIQPEDERVPGPSFLALSCLPDLLRVLRLHMRAARVVQEHETRTRGYLQKLGAADPRHLPDTEVWGVIEQWFRDAPDYMQPVLLLGGVLFHEAAVWDACEKVGFPFEQLMYPQLATGERSVSAQQAFDLVALADTARRDGRTVTHYLLHASPDLSQLRTALRGTRFLAEFERFLETYGHRGRYEYDWSLPRYREDPTPLLRTLRAHLEEGAAAEATDDGARREREAAEAWTSFEARLSTWQKWTLLPGVRRSVGKVKQYYVWREQVRSDLVRVLGAVRAWHLALAERFVERHWLDDRSDYFLLQFPEIASIVAGLRDPATLRAIVVDRLAERERLRALQMPLLMRASELPGLIRSAGVSGGSVDGDVLTGQAVSGGRVEAEVVVVRDPGDFGRMKRGAILVAPATDPSWTPLFTLASGVIVEVGGVLSHASTIAREYGLPALANVRQATRRLRTGERVRLDATHGLVSRLTPAGDSTPAVVDEWSPSQTARS